MKKIIFVFCGLLLQGNLCAIDPLKEVFKGKPWEFLENEFIIKPQSELEGWVGSIKRFIGSGAISAAGLYGSKVGIEQLLDRYEQRIPVLSTLLYNFTVTAGTVAMAYISWALSSKYFLNKARGGIEEEALLKFLVEWQENKQYAPADLHKLFDELCELVLTPVGEYKYKRLAPEMLQLIKKRIYLEFPERYKDKLHGNSGGVITTVVYDVAAIADLVVYLFKYLVMHRNHEEEALGHP